MPALYSARERAMVGRTLAHYEILDELGSGGMGVVYKAKDTHLDRFVAIKVLRADALADSERKRRFVQEAKAASALNHPNIVTIHDVASDAGTDYIVMEYVAGRTLDRLIVSGGMTLRDLLSYAGQAADALARAHAANIVHRDLKPSNLMVTDDGRVKILDFGLAKLALGTRDSAESTLMGDPVRTGVGLVVGTPAYMSPEQAEGKLVDARSDIFSFGAVLYEMATGTPAFRGESTASTLAAVLTATPPPPTQIAPRLPRELDRIIVRCLRKEPGRRFQHMADLAVELDEIRTESSESIVAAPSVPSSRSKWPWLIGALGAVVIVAAGVWTFWPRTNPAAPPTLVPLTTYQGLELMPSLSPDGTQIAFVWNGDRPDNPDIYVKPIDAVTPLRLTSDPARELWPAWSPSGRELVFTRVQPDGRGAIYVTPPIPGSERKVADVQVTGNGYPVTWTPDGRSLIVSDATGAENGVFLIAVDSGTRRAILSAPVSAVRYSGAMLSPDGDALAYIGCTVAGQAGCDLWSQPIASDFAPQGTPRSLTNLHGAINGMTWTPDGRFVLLGVTITQGALVYLWRVPITGGEPMRLDWAGTQAAYPVVSKTGRFAFSAGTGFADIWQFDLASPGGAARTHPVSSTLADFDPEFSPDGSRIAFSSSRSGQDQEIWVARADGSGAMLLTRGAAGRNRGSPRWSHDGKRILFDTSAADGVRRAYMMDATGGTPRLVSDSQANFPIWSPDEKWIYFGSNRTGRLEIWRVPSEGGTLEQVTREGGTAPRFSPDARTLFYRRQTTLYARPVAGGPEQAVVQGLIGSSGSYFPIGNEVFYVTHPDPSAPTMAELLAIDVTTRKVRSISRFEADRALGMTASPDGKTLLIGVVKTGADLMLVEHFY